MKKIPFCLCVIRLLSVCRYKKTEKNEKMELHADKQTSYYLNSDEIIDNPWSIAITGAGYQSIKAASNYPPKGHPAKYTFNTERGRTLSEFAMVYITKGKGKYINSTDSEKVQQGDLIFVYPGQWHCYYPDAQSGWDEYWILFKGKELTGILDKFINKSKPVLHIGLNESIVKLYREIQDNIQHAQKGSQQLLSGILLHLIGLANFYDQHKMTENREKQKVQEACILMQENINQKIKPEDIAKKLYMSYSSFRKIFKYQTGISPLQYMLQLKLEKIKELLETTDLPIQDIAINLGFESADYFSFFFKSKIGLNPLSYRKETAKCKEAYKEA